MCLVWLKLLEFLSPLMRLKNLLPKFNKSLIDVLLSLSLSYYAHGFAFFSGLTGSFFHFLVLGLDNFKLLILIALNPQLEQKLKVRTCAMIHQKHLTKGETAPLVVVSYEQSYVKS